MKETDLQRYCRLTIKLRTARACHIEPVHIATKDLAWLLHMTAQALKPQLGIPHESLPPT